MRAGGGQDCRQARGADEEGDGDARPLAVRMDWGGRRRRRWGDERAETQLQTRRLPDDARVLNCSAVLGPGSTDCRRAAVCVAAAGGRRAACRRRALSAVPGAGKSYEAARRPRSKGGEKEQRARMRSLCPRTARPLFVHRAAATHHPNTTQQTNKQIKTHTTHPKKLARR